MQMSFFLMRYTVKSCTLERRIAKIHEDEQKLAYLIIYVTEFQFLSENGVPVAYFKLKRTDLQEINKH